MSSECHPDSRCFTGAGWPNGYCANTCTTDEDCATGARCVEDQGGICVVECAGAGDCRTTEDDGGYACTMFESRGAGGTVMGCSGE